MALYDQTTDGVRYCAYMGGALGTLAAVLGLILAVGFLDQMAGDRMQSAAHRMSQPSAVKDWRGNSASLPSAI